jgi:hypothetical protein
MSTVRKNFFSKIFSEYCENGNTQYGNPNYWVKGTLLPLTDGTPYLEWDNKNRTIDTPGWKLSLRGTASITLGSCDWNDEEGLLTLIESMKDRSKLLTLLGLIDSKESAALASKLNLVKMRDNMEVVSSRTVRSILKKAGLIPAIEPANYKGGVMRPLKLSLGGKVTVLAVCIMAPSVPEGVRSLTRSELSLIWREQNEITEGLSNSVREDWIKKTKDALTLAGWNIVALPKPYYHGGSGEYIWATKLSDAEIAKGKIVFDHEASRFRLVGGGKF